MFAPNLKKINKMKKLVLFVSVLALGLTSCNKDDDGGTSAALEGNWEYSREGIAANGQEALTDYDHTDGCSKDYTVITATSVVDHSFGENCEEFLTTATYTRSGNTLTTTYEGQTFTSEILQLDGSTLKISTPETFEGQTMNYITVYTRR